MSHGDAFLQAVLAEPDDDAPRMIYADWLEERGDPRGAFIRLQCVLQRLGPTDLARAGLEDEASELLHQHEDEWTAELQGIASTWRFRRGFVEEAVVSGDNFLARGDDLFSGFPISCLRIQLNRTQAGAVAASPHLARLRTLDVTSCWLRDRGVEELLASPHLKRVTALGLAENDLEGPAVRALTASALMGRLAFLRLSKNASLGVSAARRLAHTPAAAALRTLDLSSTNIGPDGLRDLLASPHFKGLTSLFVRSIGTLSWAGSLMAELTRSPVLPRLTALDLGGFRHGGLPQLLQSPVLGRLTSLSLAGNDLGPETIRTLADSEHFSSLTALDLTGNSAGPEGLQALAASPRLARLRTLRLGGNGVRDAGARALTASPYLANLTELDLHKNGIGGPGVQVVAGSANFARLTALDLSENYVGLESIRSLATSGFMSRLAFLRLRSNQLDGEAARLLAGSPHLSRLETLDLDGNALSDGGLYALMSSARLTRLRELSVCNSGIGGSGGQRLGAMLADAPRFRGLRKLVLRGNPLGDNERQYLQQRFGGRVVLE